MRALLGEVGDEPESVVKQIVVDNNDDIMQRMFLKWNAMKQLIVNMDR